MSVVVQSRESELTSVEASLKREMAEVFNVSESLVSARCHVADWQTASSQLPTSALDHASAVLGLQVTDIEHLGSAMCVTDASPPPESPVAPPQPPGRPPQPPVAPPFPPFLPPGAGGQLLPPSPPYECADGYKLVMGHQKCEPCEAGTVCKRGLQEDCPRDTYSEVAVAEQSQCQQCPGNSGSSPGSMKVFDCLCFPGFMRSKNLTGEASFKCVGCPVGSICNRPGTLLEELPLQPGYWRWRLDVVDVIRCPGASGCVDGEGCAQPSGCLGSADGSSASGFGEYCKPGLGGPYCTVCADGLNKTHFYDTSEHDCLSCEGQAVSTMQLIAYTVLALIAAFFAVGSIVRCLCDHTGKRAVRWMRRWEGLKLKLRALARGTGGNEIKELVSFTQVITNVQDIYMMRFPPAFLHFTNFLAGLISFNLPLPNLACFGIGGHRERLLTFFAVPLIVCLLILLLQDVSRRAQGERP